jgi:hypothetical protein
LNDNAISLYDLKVQQFLRSLIEIDLNEIKDKNNMKECTNESLKEKGFKINKNSSSLIVILERIITSFHYSIFEAILIQFFEFNILSRKEFLKNKLRRKVVRLDDMNTQIFVYRLKNLIIYIHPVKH